MRRPAHGTVVAYIALFVALGGTTFAATHLETNSVGTKQLKKEAVTAAKVKKGTLTGSQIDIATLGTVPSAQAAQSAQTAKDAESAQTAQTAESADSVAPSEPWHEVGVPGEPQFQHSCNNPPEPNAVPSTGFYKDREGVVHLEGVIWSCAPVGEVAFQLPPGFRPGELQSFPMDGGGSVTVYPGTGFYINAGNAGGVRCNEEKCFLDGITFRAES